MKCGADFTQLSIQDSLASRKALSSDPLSKEGNQNSGKKLQSMLLFDMQRDFVDKGQVYCPDCYDYSTFQQSAGNGFKQNEQSMSSAHYNSD